uniref:Egg protein n=1 Tax=Schistosoma japonicum TaxID=6182 RepID=A1YSI5_SCHJA|nr:unknown [Schistosoma japonicum]
MSFHLRQMNSLLYWFLPTVMYFNILFLDNSVAQEPYYTDSKFATHFNKGDYRPVKGADGNKLVFEASGFTMRVQQESYNSLIVFRNGTLFVTNSDNQFRSFRIVGGNVNSEYLKVETYTSSFTINWLNMPYCRSDPEVLVTVAAVYRL